MEIKGAKVPYKATAGTQPVWDADGQVIASLFYTYYERTDVADKTSRPLCLSFNGGPGSASLWMHIAYTGATHFSQISLISLRFLSFLSFLSFILSCFSHFHRPRGAEHRR